MKRVDVDKLERLIGQIDSLRQELGALVKKAPNDLVNSFKLRFVNQVLTGVNAFLGKKSIPLEGFTHFEDDAPPSNSDVTFVLASMQRRLTCIARAMSSCRAALGTTRSMMCLTTTRRFAHRLQYL